MILCGGAVSISTRCRARLGKIARFLKTLLQATPLTRTGHARAPPHVPRPPTNPPQALAPHNAPVGAVFRAGGGVKAKKMGATLFARMRFKRF